ncbi:hypothetical protein Vdis_0180 [Vulcanisaeta distributa DSM 14429]|uniref:PLD phosphodiesterase domain-containing protein n=2 Tax=Vulcanisaeta distributa TaxID=164451 RepID=E1QSS6_VULDI|nr:hypothetical protein Vdis_0180 [Vulcanisaeta distributa DSM 14429]
MSIEELMRRFLHESFGSKYIYIISPWITPFTLSSRFIHYPYVSSNNVIDVLKALSNSGVGVKVLMRCIDDSMDIQLIRVLTNLVRERQIILNNEVKSFFRDRIDDFLNRANAMIDLARDLKDAVRFDLGADDKLLTWYRLHTKLYINDHSVIMGSANFTRGGILDDGNWECVSHFTKEENTEIYNYALRVAQHYFSISKGFSDCERRVVRIVNEFGGVVNEPIYSIEDLIEYLERVRDSLY